MPTEPDTQSEQTEQSDELMRQASLPEQSVSAELLDFVKYNKKWWLVPLVVMLLLIGGVIIFGSSVAGPFLYTLF
jgi:hypothetical protein